MKTGIELIAEERQRQICIENYDAEHDHDETAMQLSGAAACYIASAADKHLEATTHGLEWELPWSRFQVRGADGKWVDGWPWDKKFDKRDKHDALRSLVIAGALIAAEIDRIQSA